MAITNLQMVDTYYKTIIKVAINGANTSANIVDVSDLVGYVSKLRSRLSLAALTWSVSTPIDLLWAGSPDNIALSIQGNGRYGGSDGFPPIQCNNTTGALQIGDLELTSTNPCLGFVVCIFHKVGAAGYTGDAWVFD